MHARAKRPAGFTLIELMIVVAIIAILGSIAVPSYTRYVQRGDLVEATNALSQYRVQMEQYYQDNRSYLNGAACGIAVPANLVNFTVACVPGAGGQSYTATATANAASPVAGAAYTIDQSANQGTTGLPKGWAGAPSLNTWIVR